MITISDQTKNTVLSVLEDAINSRLVTGAKVSDLRNAISEIELFGCDKKFQFGDYVTKISGSKWTGQVVGYYSTELTPEGYNVESHFETGSVQIYPAKALERLNDKTAMMLAMGREMRNHA